MKRYCIFFFFFLVLGFPVKSQQEIFNIAPASPTVAELAKYAEVPISFYTGIPEITIPLYTLNCGELNLPITLTYHAGGIQVDQVASWVGLGWSLNAGGIIKHTVYSRNRDSNTVDDSSCGPLLSMKDVEKSLLGGYSFITLLSMWESKTKLIPDLYSYNFLHYCGSFLYYFDTKKRCHDLRNNKYLSWDVGVGYIKNIDLKGSTYLFKGTDRELVRNINDSYYYPSFQRGKSNTSLSNSWNLSKIVSANATDSILFTYTKMQEAYQNRMFGFLKYSNRSTGWTGAYSQEASFFQETIEADTRKISEIQASNGIKITFVADFVRQDIIASYVSTKYPSPKALSKIIIQDPSGKQLKKWIFEYGYFETQASKLSPNNYRLKLKRIKEYGMINTNPKVYTFSYYKEEDISAMSPRTYNSGHDFWGYCNSSYIQSSGPLDLFHPVDEVFIQTYNYLFNAGIDGYPLDCVNSSQTQYPPERVTLRGRNKEVNEASITTYSLKEITYPTGGRRTFEYESNSRACSGIRIRKIKNYFSQTDSLVKVYEYPLGVQIYDSPQYLKTKYDTKAFPRIVSGGSDVVSTDITSLSYLEVTSQTYNPLFSTAGEHYGYERVAEKTPSGTIYYDYYSLANFPREYRSYRVIKDERNQIFCAESLLEPVEPFAWIPTGRNYGRGILGQKTFVNQEDQLIKTESYPHIFYDTDTIPIWDIHYGMFGWSGTKFFLNYNVSQYIVGEAIMDKKITTYYNPDILVNDQSKKELEQVENYTYNSYRLLKKTETIDSEGNNISKEQTYPPEVNTTVYNQMTAKLMIDYPLEITIRNNNKVVKSDLQTYANYSGRYYPDNIYEYRNATVSSFTPYSKELSELYGAPVGTIIARSSKGNIMALRGEDQIDIVYLWGYNNQYPIAQIKNASYAQVLSYIDNLSIERIASRPIPTSTDFALIENLRNLLPEAAITIFTYIPFIGLSSICGPDMRTVYYEYDSFGQLMRTYRKENGTEITMKRYEYHYETI